MGKNLENQFGNLNLNESHSFDPAAKEKRIGRLVKLFIAKQKDKVDNITQ